MRDTSFRNLRLGVFVALGLVLLVGALYLIGAKQNLFGSTFRLHAEFHNVNGLMSGNNVRFAGIDVGTVSSVTIINDTTVRVDMLISNDVQPFIRKNARVAVGTDGLMGNKLINIYQGLSNADLAENVDLLQSKDQAGTDEMLRTLSVTNENVKEISAQIKLMVARLNQPNSLWNILMDTSLAETLKGTLVKIKISSDNTALITGDLQHIANSIRMGKGSIGALITDTSMSNGLKQSIVNIRMMSDTMASVTGDLRTILAEVKNGNGAVGTLLMDTSFAHKLNLAMENLQNGTKGFNDNMEGLKQSIFLRKYFRKKTP
ncbi:MAG: MCE family protein [Bacteroidia bacterium]|nr:MCE family protein [Bacteroidia bacterium]